MKPLVFFVGGVIYIYDIGPYNFVIYIYIYMIYLI